MNKALRGLFCYLSGHRAEREAANFLQQKGYKLIAQNVLSKKGSGANELDLVMLDKNTLVFIEVKKRTTLSNAAEAVDERLQKRLYRAAQVFLMCNPEYLHSDCRFDVVLMTDGQAPVHLQNVIEEL